MTVYQALPHTRSVLPGDIQLSSLLMLCLALCPVGKQQTHKKSPNPKVAKRRPGGHMLHDEQFNPARSLNFTKIFSKAKLRGLSFSHFKFDPSSSPLASNVHVVHLGASITVWQLLKEREQQLNKWKKKGKRK